jgi:outer membrane receptor protein involved in Fe transport
MPDSVMISIWKPSNLKHVKASGFEILMDIGCTWSKTSLNSRLSYAFNITNEETEDDHQERQLQLPYTPQHIGNFSLYLVHHSFGFIYSMNYTGKRFINYDESYELKPYLLQDVSFDYRFSVKKHEIKLNLKFYNLLNVQWENIAYQPMPGRYFHLGFSFLLNH